jgi:uncharacterized membrane protein YphA (DoxX/SURF4 family)
LAGQVVEWVLRVLMGVVLAAAGAAKAFQPEAFAVEVDRFQLTPWLLSLALGYFSAMVRDSDSHCLVLQAALFGRAARNLRFRDAFCGRGGLGLVA